MIVYLNQTRTENQKRICQDNTHNKNGHDSIIDLSRKHKKIDLSRLHIYRWVRKTHNLDVQEKLVNLVNGLLISLNY